MDCDCYEFCQKLMDLAKIILTKGDERHNWEMFQQFLTQCIRNNSHDVSSFGNEDTLCSLNICSLLINELDEFRRRSVALSTIIIDLITILLVEDCAVKEVSCVWDFEGTTRFSKEKGTLRVTAAFQADCDCAVEFMKLLLNCGFLPSLSGDSYRLINELQEVFMHFTSRLVYWDDMTVFQLNMLAMLQVKNIFFRYENQEFYRRMYLIGIAIRAILLSLKSNHCLAEKFTSGLRMYFAGTRDAFLSVFEMRSVFYAYLKNINTLPLFDMYCEEFDKLMPGSPAKIEPRSLTHLVRFQIRNHLKRSDLPLPIAVDKLDLPEMLKSFLLGEVFEITKEKGKASSAVTLAELELLEQSSV